MRSDEHTIHPPPQTTICGKPNINYHVKKSGSRRPFLHDQK